MKQCKTVNVIPDPLLLEDWLSLLEKNVVLSQNLHIVQAQKPLFKKTEKANLISPELLK